MQLTQHCSKEYGSVAEHQSCKLTVQGSIPGFNSQNSPLCPVHGSLAKGSSGCWDVLLPAARPTTERPSACSAPSPHMDTLAEWPRRRPAKPMAPRVGSNPTGVALMHPSQMMPAYQFYLTHHNAYTWPGSNWRPSACEADVIATRPQLLFCT